MKPQMSAPAWVVDTGFQRELLIRCCREEGAALPAASQESLATSGQAVTVGASLQGVQHCNGGWRATAVQEGVQEQKLPSCRARRHSVLQGGSRSAWLDVSAGGTRP